MFFQCDTESLEGTSLAAAIANADRYANRSTLRPLKDLQLIQAIRPWLRGKGGDLCRRETHILTEQGAAFVQSHFDLVGKGEQLTWNPSLAELDGTNQAHAEALVDVYIAFKRAVRPPFIFWGWKGDRELMGLARRGSTLLRQSVPDAVFILSERAGEDRQHVPFFVELDRATETVQAFDGRRRDWMGKIERFEAYFAGPFHRDPLFRGISALPKMLTVTTSHRRLSTLREATAKVSPTDRYLFTTLDALLTNERGDLLAAPIWESAADTMLSLSAVTQGVQPCSPSAPNSG